MRKFSGNRSGIESLVDMIRWMQVDEDLDALIGVSGFKGFGKSTFSKQFVRHYCEKYTGIKEFRPNMLEKYTAYTAGDIENMVDTLPNYSPIDADEAVNFAMGEDWMKGENKRTKKRFAKMRNKHFAVLFNIPDLWWLDKKYRENMMTVWVHIIKKGFAIVSFPNLAPGIDDRWDRNWLLKNFKKNPINYFTNVEDTVRMMKRYSCYFDMFHFDKLPEPIYQKHLELRNAKVSTDSDSDTVENLTDYKWREACKWMGHNFTNGGSKLLANMVKKNKTITWKDIWKIGFINPYTNERPTTYRAFTSLHEEAEKERIAHREQRIKENIQL